MENRSKFADLKNDKEILDKITGLEKELSEKIGRKVILVAYND